MTAKKKPAVKLSTADDKAPDLDTKGTEAKVAELSTADDKAPDLDAKGTEAKVAELSTADDKAPDLDAKGTEAKVAEYRVADGTSVTTKRGTLSAGVSIEPRDLSGGQASIDALLKSKKIKKL